MRVAWVSIVLLTTLAGLRSQEPKGGPTFRAAADLVPVDVTVLDAERRPVRDLAAADFRVLDNGRARPVVSFAAIDLATRPQVDLAHDASVAAPALLAPPNVLAGSAVGRLVAIVMQQAPTPGRPVAGLRAARSIASTAVDALGPQDLALVAYSFYGVVQRATSDRARLAAALVAPFEDATEAEPDPHTHRCSPPLEVMAHVAESMRNSPRRKVLIYVGSSLVMQAPGQTCLKAVRERLFATLREANITVHTFDTTGLETLATPAERAAAPSVDRTGRMTSHLVRQGNLQVLPDLTGGRGIQNTNRPEEFVRDVLAESAHYYLLGIRPEAGRPGTVHKVEVRVSRRDVLVQARQTYTTTGPAVRP